MKKLLYLSVIGFALLCVACENKTEYVKKSYINEDAVVDGVPNPMRNIPWLADKQLKYYDNASERRYKSKALILFTAYGDSVEHIFEYEYHFYIGIDPDVSVGFVYNLDGTLYFDDGQSRGEASSLSSTTSEMIINLIDEKIYQYNKQKHFAFVQKAPPPPPIYSEIDTILNNATNIEVLSCFKMVEVIK